MQPLQGYRRIRPDDLHWRPSNTMRIPNADLLERTGSQMMGVRLWSLPAGSANTLHRHIDVEEFYFVLEGVGRIRIDGETLTVPRHGGVLVGPAPLRQVFNDTDADVLWLIVSSPADDRETDPSRFYPEDPTQLPPELDGVVWPPGDARDPT